MTKRKEKNRKVGFWLLLPVILLGVYQITAGQAYGQYGQTIPLRTEKLAAPSPADPFDAPEATDVDPFDTDDVKLGQPAKAPASIVSEEPVTKRDKALEGSTLLGVDEPRQSLPKANPSPIGDPMEMDYRFSSIPCGDACDAVCGTACGSSCKSSCGTLKNIYRSLHDGRGIEMDVWAAGGCYYNFHGDDNFSNEPQLFTDNPGFALHQFSASIYKDAVGRVKGRNQLDWGARVDYFFGSDAPLMQTADDGKWDSEWDTGFVDGVAYYGSSIPQLYAEIAYGKWSAKYGRFFNPVVGESVVAKENFFFSRTYRREQLLPMTVSGALATYKMSPYLTMSAGWTDGYNGGFVSDRGGSMLVANVQAQLTKRLSLGWGTNVGKSRFNYTTISEDVDINLNTASLEYLLTKKLTWRVDAAYSSTDSTLVGKMNSASVANNLFCRFNDRWSVGARFEWFWEKDVAGGTSNDLYATTVGVNWRPIKCLLFRPEVRYDSSGSGMPYNLGRNAESWFAGFDMITQF